MNATAAPAAPAAVLAAAIERARPLAVAAARPRTTRHQRGTGRYPVTVGGYVIGEVRKVTVWTARGHYIEWGATAADGAAVLDRHGCNFDTRRAAVDALAATDGGIEAYRAAARKGVFGFPAERAIEADDAALDAALEAQAANINEGVVAACQAIAEPAPNPAPLVNCGTCEALAGFTCDPGCTGAAERVTAERDDRNEHDALRGVKWVDGCPLPGEMCDPDVDHDHDPIPDAIITNQEVAVTAPAQPRTIPYVPGRTGWAAGTATPADKWLTVWGSAYDTELLFVDRADAQARADSLNASAPRDRVVVRHVRVVANPGVTLTGTAFRILPEPGAAYRAALAADAPTGDPCPACHQLHDTAGAEAECIAQADQ